MDDELESLRARGVTGWRLRVGEHVESPRTQHVVVGVILLNAVLLGLETVPGVVASAGSLIGLLDTLCLAVFVVELGAKLIAHGRDFPRSGWRVFDLVVVVIALAPGTGPWAVLRALRVLRVLRLLTVVPALRRVVAAFLHAIPGLLGVVAVMAIFFYTAAVLATELFGDDFPEWFGGIGPSLYTLFQVMTLESWSMGIVRPVMEQHPGAWAFFVPFIVIATFTILNLFIGIIVSTMQELATASEPAGDTPRAAAPVPAPTGPTEPVAPAADLGAPAPLDRAEALAAVVRLEADLARLRAALTHDDAPPSGAEERGVGRR